MAPIKKDINPSWDHYLHKLYYDPKQPGSFQGIQKVYHWTKKEARYPLGQDHLQRWLQNQPAYSRNRAFQRKSINRTPVVVTGLYDQFDADLADYQKLAGSNDGVRFLLVVIDIFSRYTWVEPLKNKTNVEVIKAMEHIFRQQSPRRLRTDQGLEFTTKIMKEFYQHYNVNHFVSYNEVKANFAERVIKTLKSKLQRYMVFYHTDRYIDVLQDIVTSYNTTYHKSIKMAPSEVNADNESYLWWFQYLPKTSFENFKIKSFKFQIGDYVRIADTASIFAREWRNRWTREIFKIEHRYLRHNIPVYKIVDKNDEEVKGTFYERELQKVLQDPKPLWKVEHILKNQGKGNQQKSLVKFEGWPGSYNRWIPTLQAHSSLQSQRGKSK